MVAGQSISFANITELQFHSGQLTVSGRTPSVPQIECVSSIGCGWARKYYEPLIITCTKTEVDEKNGAIEWKCKPNAAHEGVKITSVVVSCERYASKYDADVLIGSCSLVYRTDELQVRAAMEMFIELMSIYYRFTETVLLGAKWLFLYNPHIFSTIFFVWFAVYKISNINLK